MEGGIVRAKTQSRGHERCKTEVKRDGEKVTHRAGEIARERQRKSVK